MGKTLDFIKLDCGKEMAELQEILAAEKNETRGPCKDFETIMENISIS